MILPILQLFLMNEIHRNILKEVPGYKQLFDSFKWFILSMIIYFMETLIRVKFYFL